MAAVTIACCSKCEAPLLQNGEEDKKVVALECGHVFHKACIKQWCNVTVKGDNTDNGSTSSQGSQGTPSSSKKRRYQIVEVYCPKTQCVQPIKWHKMHNHADGLLNLFFDKTVNSDYPRLQSAYQQLEIEKEKVTEEKRKVENERDMLQEKIKKLQNENQQVKKTKAIMEAKVKAWKGTETEKENLKEICKKLTLAVNKGMTETKRLQMEKDEFRRGMITGEIKMTLMTNVDLLEEKFVGDLKWDDLTPEFQKDLLGKLQISGRHLMNFDDFFPINSTALMRLIRAGEKDENLLQKIIEDYFEEKKQANGKVGWEDLHESLRKNLTKKLRETSQVKSLELEQVPLSSNILVHLIKDQSESNRGYLGKIVAGYVDDVINESSTSLIDLFKVALLECVNSQIIGCLKLDFLNPPALERLVELGMLRMSDSEFQAPYQFVHDCVKHCINGMMMSKLMEQVNVSRMIAFPLLHEEGYSNPLGFYFADYWSGIKQRYMTNDVILAKLFMTLSVMKLPILELEPLIAVLKQCGIDVRGIVFSRKVPLMEDLNFTLLHAAAITGDLEKVKCLLYKFGFQEEVTYPRPRFQKLMLACVENTKECSGEQIQQREDIIKELVKLNGDLVSCDPPSPSLHVHEGLMKFMVELGAESWIPLVAA